MPVAQRSLALLLLRVGVGSTFLFAGLEKVVRGPGFSSSYVAGFGMPWPDVLGPAIGWFEFVGGPLLILGFATRALGVLFATEMVVAILVARLPDAELAASVVDAFALIRLELLIALASMALALLGPGKWSLDALIGRARVTAGAAPGRHRRLARAREAQVDLARARVRPARRDDLAARVELHALGAVHVQVAEERRLPAAERVVRDRHRDGHVDADHARLAPRTGTGARRRRRA